MWQTVERKARFIAQSKTGDLDARTAEDIGSDELGNAAAATKAAATGDPRYLQQVQLDDDVKRLTALKHAYGDAQSRHRSEQRTYSTEVAATTEQRETLAAALQQIRPPRRGSGWRRWAASRGGVCCSTPHRPCWPIWASTRSSTRPALPGPRATTRYAGVSVTAPTRRAL